MNSSPSYFNLAGLRLKITCNSDTLKDAFDKAFSLSRVDNICADIELAGYILEDDRFFDSVPAHVKDRLGKQGEAFDPILFYGPEDELTVIAREQDTVSYVVSRPPYKKIGLCCLKLTGRKAPMLFQSVIIPAFSEIYLMRNSLLMHAASAAAPDGRGVLLLADGGGGKTTTSLAMAQNGFKFLCDDLVVVKSTSSGFMIEPIREKINLTKKTVGFFPEMGFLKPRFKQTDEGKIQADPKEILSEDSLSDSAQAASVVEIRINRSGPELQPQGVEGILRQLNKAATFAKREIISQKSVKLLLELVEKTDSFHFYTGAEPLTAGRYLADRLILKNCRRTEGMDRLKRVNLKFKSGRDAKSRRRVFALLTDENIKADDFREEDLSHIATLFREPSFYSWAAYHRIDALLAFKLARLSRDLGPDAGRRPAVDTTPYSALWLEQKQWAGYIFARLDEMGVSAFMPRGQAFALQYYPEPAMRNTRDIDIVVEKKDVGRLEEMLENLGFSLLGEREKWEKKGELPYRKDRITVEIHWDIYPASAGISFDFRQIMNQTRSVNIDGQKIPALSGTPLLIASCLHLALEHRFDRLHRLYDIRRIIHVDKSCFDWDEIRNIAIDRKNYLSMMMSLLMAKEAAGAEVPDEIINAASKQKHFTFLTHKIFPPIIYFNTPSMRAGLRRFLLFKYLKTI